MMTPLPQPDMTKWDPIYQRIGSRVRDRRLACGVSQEELARLLGIERPTLSRYERADRRITLPILLKIAHYLAIPISFFFQESDAPVAVPASSTTTAVAPMVDDRMTAIIQELQHHPVLIEMVHDFITTMITDEGVVLFERIEP